MGLYCCYDGDSEPYYLRTAEFRTARKAYTCDECRRSIELGEEYHYQFGYSEGYGITERYCSPCASIMSALAELGFCCEQGELSEAYRQYLTEHVPQPLSNGRTVDEQVARVFPNVAGCA